MQAIRLFLLAAFASGCGANRTPIVQPLSDLLAAVGVELSFQVRATDADGDPVSFDFKAPALPDLKTRPLKATLTPFSDGVAIFRWTPQAADRSSMPYAFDFRVADSRGAVTTETMQITVREGGGAAPTFRKPLGTGTTLDLAQANCVNLEVLAEDLDSTQVILDEESPRIAGALLTQTGPFEATWRWCPTQAQINAQDRYMLTLSADDGESEKALKSYLIVLRRAPMNCPGAAPAIMHTPPGPQTTASNITITAVITDDRGLKGVPLLYYAETPPGSPPDLSKMVQATLTLTSGNTFTGSLPSPVALSPAGTMKTLHYLIIADDDDDPLGPCDHSTMSPAYTVVVTAPQMCTDDTYEPNQPAGGMIKGTVLSLTADMEKVVTGLRVCPGNEDWFLNYFVAGRVVTVSIELTQASPAQDLDLLLVKEEPSLPAGFVEVAASTGTTGNEQLMYTTPTDGWYDIVVKGKTPAAENSYTLKALKQ